MDPWLDEAPTGYLGLDPSHGITRVNGRLAEWLGTTPEALVGQSFFTLVDTPGRLFFLASIQPLLQNTGLADEIFMRLQLSDDGSSMPVLANFRSTQAPDGTCTLIGLMPIHQRQLLEEQLVQAKRTAEEAVAERERSNHELEETRRVLEARNQELSELNEQLQYLATTDPLTELVNRRTFDSFLTQELAQQHRRNQKFCLAMMDIDHLKAINDDYGHQVGDEALRQVSALINHCIRETDIVARMGGEEFAAILPDTGLDDALEVAQRIRETLATASLPCGTVTISQGIAESRANDTETSLMSRADGALYEAKKAGRDRVKPSH
ncbi:sensor domain-containing diguanylate cyclase [Salicola sp. Rm-C-2C1-2]|uniref:sensor domain-containing diguanylate cyclase n=1 Tax=Salicola sp. Rm-C-2C1-2 TaxID=3141321 RepID=UPI0032E3C483